MDCNQQDQQQGPVGKGTPAGTVDDVAVQLNTMIIDEKNAVSILPETLDPDTCLDWADVEELNFATIERVGTHHPTSHKGRNVRIRFAVFSSPTDPKKISFRFVAARAFKKGDWIYHDKDVLTMARFNPSDPDDKDGLQYERTAHELATLLCAPVLFPYTFPELETIETEIGKYLKQFVTDLEIRKFFRDHAFCSPSDVVSPTPAALTTPPARQTKPQYIFPLLSLLSDCDQAILKHEDGPNCDWFFGINTTVEGEEGLAIRARRDIKENEELTIHFPRRGECERCTKRSPGAGSSAIRDA